MVSTEYLLLAAVILGCAGWGLSEVRDGIKDQASEFGKEQKRLIEEALHDTRRTKSGDRTGAIVP